MDTKKNTGTAHSRRDFLKGTGLVVAGVAGLTAAAGLAGCASTDDSAADAPADAQSVAWDEEFDVVVIGAGGAGTAAAVTVATEGEGVSCLLVEKGDTPAGNTPLCGGGSIWADDPDVAFKYLKQLAGEFKTTPDEVLQAFAQGLTENVDWLIKLGVNQEEMAILSRPSSSSSGMKEKTASALGSEYPELEYSYSVGKFAVGKNPDVEVKGPKHIQDFLLEVIAQHTDSITYRTSSVFSDLIQEADTKAIVGVVVDGKNIKANKGVILTCGGFEFDPVMMEDYVGMGSAFSGGGVGNTGDGHRACMRIGADFWHMNHVAGFWLAGRDLENTVFTNVQVINPAPKTYGFTVGLNGRRFYMDWDGYVTALDKAYDTDISLSVGSRHGHMQYGGEWPHLPMPSKAWYIFDSKGLAAGALSDKLTTNPVADGYAYSAESIEELAALIDVPVDELVATTASWNECCAKGDDIFFHRPAKTLVPVVAPPFYAQRCAPAFLNTDGGPRRNEKAQILDIQGNPIPNLYSSGEFGSVWGGYYQGSGNIAECLVFSRIAVREILSLT
jgi:hypothetical protein